MSDTQHRRPWTPAPWRSLVGEVACVREAGGLGAFAVAGNYDCDGSPVDVAWAIDVDDAGWPGIGCTESNAALIALAPRMAETILQEANDAHECLTPGDDCVVCMAEELRAIIKEHDDE